MTGFAIARVVLRFHLAAGVRVAVRSLAPLAAGFVAAAVLLGEVGPVLTVLSALFVPGDGSVVSAALLVVLLAGLAAAAAPRLTAGLDCWLRHLPAPAAIHRRAVTAGVVVALLPVLLLLAVAGLVGPSGRAVTVNAAALGLPLVAWCATLVALPVRPVARLLALAAGLAAAVSGAWLAAALGLVLIADGTAGRLVLRSRRASRSWRQQTSGSGPVVAWRVWLVIIWRALLWRRVVGAWCGATLVFLPLALFLRNNQLAEHQAGLAARLAGMLAALMVVSVLVGMLARRRPTWPFSRTLPWSAAVRVGIDAVVLGVLTTPVLLAAALIGAGVLAVLVGSLPFLALRGAAAMRSDHGSGSGEVFLMGEGFMAAALVALQPASVLLLLALCPLAVRWAASRERRLPVGRFCDLSHHAAGDSLSWSDV